MMLGGEGPRAGLNSNLGAGTAGIVSLNPPSCGFRMW